MKELNKTIQDLKMEIKTIEKSQRKTTLEIENLGKRSRVMDEQNHEQNIRDRRENLWYRRYHRKHWYNSQRKCKMQKAPNPKHPGNPGYNEKTNPKDNRCRRE